MLRDMRFSRRGRGLLGWTPCSGVVGYRRFGGPCCLPLQLEAGLRQQALLSFRDTTCSHNLGDLDLKGKVVRVLN
jgi:hypothetical protein